MSNFVSPNCVKWMLTVENDCEKIFLFMLFNFYVSILIFTKFLYASQGSNNGPFFKG